MAITFVAENRFSPVIMGVSSAGVSLIMVLLVATIPAHAIDISGEIDAITDVSSVTFIGQRYITIEYPSGSWLQQQFIDEHYNISFTVAPSDPKISRVVSAFNEQFANKSTDVRMESAQVLYYIILEGAEDGARIFYNVEVNATLQNLVSQPANGETMEPVSVDLSWRDVNVNQSIALDIGNFTDLDINSPMGFISAYKPQVAQKLAVSEQASMLLRQPLLNFAKLGAQLSEWKTTELGEDAFYISFGEAAKSPTELLRELEPTFDEESVITTIEGSETRITSETRSPSGQFLFNSQNIVIVPEFGSLSVVIAAMSIATVLVMMSRSNRKAAV